MANEKRNCNQICRWNDPSDGCIKPTYATCPMANTEPDASGCGQVNERRFIDANALQFKPEPVDNIMNGVLFIRGRGVGKTVAMVSEALKRMIENAPTVDAVEVVHGKWNEINQMTTGLPWKYRCNKCGCPQDYAHNYCPNCGAKMMDGGNEDG